MADGKEPWAPPSRKTSNEKKQILEKLSSKNGRAVDMNGSFSFDTLKIAADPGGHGQQVFSTAAPAAMSDTLQGSSSVTPKLRKLLIPQPGAPGYDINAPGSSPGPAQFGDGEAELSADWGLQSRKSVNPFEICEDPEVTSEAAVDLPSPKEINRKKAEAASIGTASSGGGSSGGAATRGALGVVQGVRKSPNSFMDSLSDYLMSQSNSGSGSMSMDSASTTHGSGVLKTPAHSTSAPESVGGSSRAKAASPASTMAASLSSPKGSSPGSPRTSSPASPKAGSPASPTGSSGVAKGAAGKPMAHSIGTSKELDRVFKEGALGGKFWVDARGKLRTH